MIILLLNVAVDVKRLFKLGKEYPWPRPCKCPGCHSKRLWSHGYETRCFVGYLEKLWVKKYRCADCESVHTMRPETHWKRFQYSSVVIMRCIVNKLKKGMWHKAVCRQNQQYWWKGLRIQASRFRNVKTLSVDVFRRFLNDKIIAVSHAIDCEILRL